MTAQDFDGLTDAERCTEVLHALARRAMEGDAAARRYVGQLLGLRRTPTVEELRRMGQPPD